MSELSRRQFAEQLALLAAAPWFVEEHPWRGQGLGNGQQQQAQEPSALAKAIAEMILLRYPDRFSPDDVTTITRSIDNRLRQIDRLYQTPLSNADEPDFVYSVYRGAD